MSKNTQFETSFYCVKDIVSKEKVLNSARVVIKPAGTMILPKGNYTVEKDGQFVTLTNIDVKSLFFGKEFYFILEKFIMISSENEGNKPKKKRTRGKAMPVESFDATKGVKKEFTLDSLRKFTLGKQKVDEKQIIDDSEDEHEELPEEIETTDEAPPPEIKKEFENKDPEPDE